MPKTVEQIQQKTNDRKYKKNTIPEALISNRENEVKENPIKQTNVHRKIRTKTEIADIAKHQIGNLNLNAQPENQYFKTAKRKDTSGKYADPNTENNTKLTKLRTSLRPKKLKPTGR